MSRPGSWIKGTGLKERYPSKPLYERFWDNTLVPTNKNECWIWTGGVNNKNYGQTHVRTMTGFTTTKASRVSWMLHNGPIPDGIEVCHTCDNGICVNPDHLFLGTHQDNMRDAKAKGRFPCPPTQKLNEEKVLEIRKRVGAGEKRADLAKEYGVNADTIGKIFRKATWGHI